MDEATFWGLIDRARSGRASSADAEALRTVLDGESNEAVAAFGEAMGRQMARLYRWPVWGAAYVIQGGASDDLFLYFCEGLIGRGREAVEQALADPDGLGPYVSDEPEENENEGLAAVAFEVLERRGVEGSLDYYPQGEPEGEPFDEETVYEAYPKLAARFG